MSYFCGEPGAPEQGSGHVSYDLLTQANGCVNGCIAGISDYTETEYGDSGCHEDQEGFYVVSGTGWAKVGNEEKRIAAGDAFFVPPGVAHTMKAECRDTLLRVFWFHASV